MRREARTSPAAGTMIPVPEPILGNTPHRLIMPLDSLPQIRDTHRQSLFCGEAHLGEWPRFFFCVEINCGGAQQRSGVRDVIYRSGVTCGIAAG